MAIVTNVKYWYTRTGTFAREIVLKQAVIMATIVGVLGALTTAGIIPTGVSESVTGYIVVGFAVVAGLVNALWTRHGVTPADPDLNPVSKNGLPLVEVDSAILVPEYQAEHAAVELPISDFDRH